MGFLSVHSAGTAYCAMQMVAEIFKKERCEKEKLIKNRGAESTLNRLRLNSWGDKTNRCMVLAYRFAYLPLKPGWQIFDHADNYNSGLRPF